MEQVWEQKCANRRGEGSVRYIKEAGLGAKVSKPERKRRQTIQKGSKSGSKSEQTGEEKEANITKRKQVWEQK